jgi:GMP synthase-like glutamine amidotransferase
MSVLILKNISSEGPGTLGDFLLQKGIPHTIADLASEPVPSGDGFDSLVMMGGPMSVNDENEYPYLTAEMRLAEQFMNTGKRVFGVCLGAQLMAKAMGARVYAGSEKEIGWYDIELKETGLKDPLMARLAPEGRHCKVFQWHGETFDIPAGAERLAGSDLYPNQAFRYGGLAYAFQFHIEVGRQMIIDWMKNEPVDLEKIARETEAYYADYAARALSFYKAFFPAG